MLATAWAVAGGLGRAWGIGPSIRQALRTFSAPLWFGEGPPASEGVRSVGHGGPVDVGPHGSLGALTSVQGSAAASVQGLHWPDELLLFSALPPGSVGGAGSCLASLTDLVLVVE